jgi:hypothetical protein
MIRSRHPQGTRAKQVGLARGLWVVAPLGMAAAHAFQPPTRPAPVRPTLRIVYSGNMRGILEPCGCQALQPGGLSRRATLLAALRRQTPAPLLVDPSDNLPAGQAMPEGFPFSPARRARRGAVGIRGDIGMGTQPRRRRLQAHTAAVLAGTEP